MEFPHLYATLLQSDNPPKIEGLQKTIQSKERAASHTLPENFVESLRERVDNSQNSPQLTGKINFIAAERQADPLLARRLLHGEIGCHLRRMRIIIAVKLVLSIKLF
jgi:hypothetical protein